jgi:hypothetical protein
MARVTGAELRSLRAEADRVAGIADRLRDAVATVAAEADQFRADAGAAAGGDGGVRGRRVGPRC